MAIIEEITAEEYARLPQSTFYRDELIRGVQYIREPGPPGYAHGSIDATIGHLLYAFVMPRRLGQVVHNAGFVFERNPDTVLGPDIAFVEASRVPAPDGPAYPDGAPDLAVEVLSPSNTRTKMSRRLEIYLRTGTRLVWVVDRKRRTVTVHRPNHEPVVLGAEDQLSGEDVLPGFACRVADVFGR